MKASLVGTLVSLMVPFAASAVDTLSFEDLRTSCLNPGKYHNQVAPNNIQVNCKNIITKWIPDTGVTLNLMNTRQVVAAITSDKYTSAPVTQLFPVPDQAVICPKFKEIQENVETVRAVTCTQLVAFTGTVTEFCAATVDALRTSNPDAIKVADTGKVQEFCGGAAAPASQPAQPPRQ